LLMETGQIDRVVDYNLVWPPGFELSDQTKADIALKEAQARSLQLKWMTVDEVRVDQGLDPLPEDAGKVILGLPIDEIRADQGLDPLPELSEDEKQLEDVENEGLLKRFSSFLRREKKVE